MNITLEQVKKEIEADPRALIFYDTQGCWWTHSVADLKNATEMGRAKRGLTRGADTVPMSPQGSVLLQAPADKFLQAAESKPDHYGKHKLDAFMAAHHRNCKGFCWPEWQRYNDMLDKA